MSVFAATGGYFQTIVPSTHSSCVFAVSSLKDFRFFLFYRKSLFSDFAKLCISQLVILVVPAACSSFCYAHKETLQEINHCSLSTAILFPQKSVQFERLRDCQFYCFYSIHYLKYILFFKYAFILVLSGFRFRVIKFLFQLLCVPMFKLVIRNFSEFTFCGSCPFSLCLSKKVLVSDLKSLLLLFSVSKLYDIV